jgi:hypothetical protein
MFKFDSSTSPRLINEVFAELIGPDGAMEFWEKFRANYITRDDIRFIRRTGLNSVRIPFNYRLFTPEGHPGIWLKEGFMLLDRVIGWCKEEGLVVVLDMHCAPGGQTGDNIDDSWGYPWLFESPASQERVAEIWRRIAERYRNEPAVIGYDLMNEPIAHFLDTGALNPKLMPVYRTIIRAVRTVDTHHIIFLGGAQWDTNFGIFTPPFEPGVAYTFHRYWVDTSQSVIQDYVDFQTKNNVVLWLGESGENSDEWIGAFRRILERNSIGWCFWPYKKMDAKSCMVTFDRPDGYRDVINYANKPRSTFEQIRSARPPVEKVKRVLEGFLENCKFSNCRINSGYLRALGVNEEVK